LRGLYLFKDRGWIFAGWSQGILEVEGIGILISSPTYVHDWLYFERIRICIFLSRKISKDSYAKGLSLLSEDNNELEFSAWGIQEEIAISFSKERDEALNLLSYEK